jgi:hypothetical protein
MTILPYESVQKDKRFVNICRGYSFGLDMSQYVA